jgi:hypothetical protein
MKPPIDPSEILYEIKFESVLTALRRRGRDDLSPEDLQLARDEVCAAIEHHLDEREYIAIGLDSWEIIRNL